MASNPVKTPVKFVPPQSGQIVFSALTPSERVTFLGNSFWSVKNALVKVFGDFPITLDSSHLYCIRAMSAASGEGCAPYDQIAEALERHGGLSIAMEKTKDIL